MDIERLEPEAMAVAIDMVEKANADLSGHRVGASVIAFNGKDFKVFGGHNIELSQRDCYHAEESALVKAITEGYTLVLKVIVTSSNYRQRAALCGHCMEIFNRCNPDTEIIVLEPDGKVKLRTTVRKRNGPMAYMGSIHLTLPEVQAGKCLRCNKRTLILNIETDPPTNNENRIFFDCPECNWARWLDDEIEAPVINRWQ